MYSIVNISTILYSSSLENPMDGGAWWASVHGVAKSQTRLSDFTFTFHFHVSEKEMATHSSVLAWRIPGTREPGGLPSMGSQSQTRLKGLSSSSSGRTFPSCMTETLCPLQGNSQFLFSSGVGNRHSTFYLHEI